MNKGTEAAKRAFLIASGVLLALPGVALAQPNLTAFSFTPTSINTAAGPASVVVNFSATDSSNIFYFEMAFGDPTGVYLQRGFKLLTPSPTITDSVTVTFPRFSNSGNWQVVGVFVADVSGNTTFLDATGLARNNFPTSLQVTSAVDNTPPALAAFSLSPVTINTTAGAATVTANFTLTDDLAGANAIAITLTSPSGNSTRSATANFTPALTVNSTANITFPQFSEAGTWTVSSVYVSDAAGNTTILSNTSLTNAGFPSTLAVTSLSDTTPPTLTAFSFTPTSINVTGAPATVTFSFQATDDLSGVTSIQTNFLSPSGAYTQSASANFTATTSATATATTTFPKGSENGTWVIASALLTDAVGNTRTLATTDLSGLGFPTQLTVINTPGDTTPPVIVPTVSPTPNIYGWNTTAPVTVTWSVTDPESGISSSTGCGNSSLSAETAGTTFTCSATNGVGLTNSVSVTVRIDLTPPIVAPSVSPSPNAAGWNNTNATVTWNFTDPVSGINSDQTSCAPTVLTAETAGTVVSCTAVNGAGLSQTASVTVKIDMTPPTATATASPAPNAAGWNSTNVTVTFAGTDALSGIASCTAPVTLSAEGAGQSASGTCTDRAGNVSAAATASGINIDKTAPIVVPTVAPAPNSAGWNNTSPVTVTWSVSDPSPGSSIASSTGCTTSTVTAETAGTTFTCTATNIAGLTTTVSVTVKLDKTPPVTTVTPSPGTLPPLVPLASVTASAVVKTTGGTTVGTLAVSCFNTPGLVLKMNATDNAGGSGVASLTYAATGAQPIASTTVNGSSAQPSITAAGQTTVTLGATDVAGNHEATKTESVTVGKSADGLGFACAAPITTFAIPDHGSLVLTGTVTIFGVTTPFSTTVTF